MTVPVGHLFDEGEVKEQDIYGRWIIDLYGTDKTTKGVLKSNYIPKGLAVRRGGKLKDLVVIGYGKILHVAISGYFQKLVDHYYESHFAREKISNWKTWFLRWPEECGEDFRNNFKVTNTNIELRRLKYFELHGKDYRLPILGYRDLEFLEGEPLFFPKEFGSNSASRSVYMGDGNSDLPLKYTAILSGRTDEKEVVLFLHGYHSPAKWHYGVWQHMLEGSSLERKQWEYLVGEQFSPQLDVFDSCKINDKGPSGEGTSCDEDHCVNESLYRTVHPEIKSLCKLYLEKIINHFESPLDKNTIRIFKDPAKNTETIVLRSFFESFGIAQRLVMAGVCHNWSEQQPTLHLNPVTMFLASKTPSRNFKFLEGKTSDGGIPVFEGSLREVKRC